MKLIKVSAFCAVILMGLAAWAQDFPRVEVAADYSYARFYPVKSESLSLNGGGGALVVNLKSYLGIKMDLQGYGSNTITRANGNLTAQGNLFTYMFGPQVKFRTPKFQPFFEVLFGAAHSNVYANLTTACALSCTTTSAPAGDAFAMALGGGIDIPITKGIQFRPVQLDYMRTRFTNQFNDSAQSNFRFLAGINLAFGGGSH
jgi:hypothetical protein